MAFFTLFLGCDSLDTENLNNPDTRKVLATGNDLPGILSGGFLSWWQGVHQSHPGMTLGVASDAISCSWGNFGMRRMSWEPRQSYNNSTSETPDYTQVVTDPWNGCYAAISTSNDVIAALNSGLSLGDKSQDKMLLSSALLLRGLGLGYLGLLFDQAYITDENTDLDNLVFSEYNDVIAAAVVDLETAIAVATEDDLSFSTDAAFINGVTLTNDELAALASSYAARFIAQAPRTVGENNAADWAAVEAFASKGIRRNFSPIADGNVWFGYWRYAHIGTGGPNGSWARLDQRLVNAFDNSQPTTYTQEAPPNPKVAFSPDARLTSDFTFVEGNNFRPERGFWHFSHYKHSRNLSESSYIGDGISNGPMPAFTTTDNELLLAEALYRNGKEADAAAIVNAGTRVTRGKLSSVPTSGPEILEAIIYERFIETLNTGPSGHFFDRRRIADRVKTGALDALGGLQEGTPAHLPVPAQELELINAPTYNFGGDSDPTGLERQ